MAEGAAAGAAAGWETFKEAGFDSWADAFEDEVPLPIEPPPAPPLARELEEVATTEELLDQGESLLQEYRGGSPKLIDRLCTPESVCILVEHATQQPREGILPDQARLRSHTAAELLALCAPVAEGAQDEPCKLRLTQAFFAGNGDGANPLDLLWSFLLDAKLDPRSSSWTVLAGYFCNVASSLYHRCPGQVLEYLRQQGTDQVLASFLRFLGTRCVAELFATLLCASEAEQGFFEVDGLILTLVEHLSGESPAGEDANENLALVLKTLLCQACCKKLYYSTSVFAQMSSPVVVERLVSKMCGETGDGAAACAAASVLVSAVSQLLHFTPNLSLASRGPNLLRPFEEEESHAAEEEVDDSLRDAGKALVQQICQHLPTVCDGFLGPAVQQDSESSQAAKEQQVLDGQRLREATVLLLEAKETDVCSEDLWSRLLELASGSKLLEDTLSAHLALRDGSDGNDSSEVWKTSQLIADLRRARALHEAEASTLCHTAQRSRNVSEGPAAVEAMSLLVELARLQDPTVLQVFASEGVLHRGLRHLFHRPWGTLMLNSVCALCIEIIRSADTHAKEAIESLLEEGLVLERVAGVLRQHAEVREALSQRQDHKGELAVPEIAAPLRKICVELREAGGRWQEVHMGLFMLDAWTEVILPDLEEFTQLEQEPLGGFNKAGASFAPVVDPGEVEFTPEDLRDIDEDFDTQCLLSLAGEQMLQRQARVAAQKQVGGTEEATEMPHEAQESEPFPEERDPGDRSEWC